MCVYALVICQVSGGWAEDRTSRASLAPSIRAGRVKGDLETRGRTGDLPASAASRSPPRTSPREAESSPQTSEYTQTARLRAVWCDHRIHCGGVFLISS